MGTDRPYPVVLTPPGGAGDARCTVKVTGVPATTVLGEMVAPASCGPGVKVIVAVLVDTYLAVNVLTGGPESNS
jgi:hypothetical protein